MRDRLDAPSQPLPQALFRQEHDNIMETELVHMLRQAKQRSDSVRRQGPNAASSAANNSQIVDSMRQQAQLDAEGGPISPHPRHAQTMGAGSPPHQQKLHQRKMPNAH